MVMTRNTARSATISADGTIEYGPARTSFRKCGNRKVGTRTLTTSRDQSTCPLTCPLIGAGCYGENVASAGGTTLFENVGGRSNGIALDDLVRASARGNRPAFRVNVVGDYLAPDQSPDLDYITSINDASDAMRANGTVSWGYTHAWNGYGLSPDTFTYVVRASCNSAAEVSAAHAQGWYAAVVCETADSSIVGSSIDGRKVVVCPVVAGTADSCADCRLCGRRAAVVAFPLHGAGTRKAVRAGAAAR